MKLYHKTPCAECPWRKEAVAGWTGGIGAEFYADALALNESPACHLRDAGPDDPDTAFCAGALAVAQNACILLDRTPGAREAANQVGRRDDVFRHHVEFFQHHTSKPYVPPIIRRLERRG